MQRIVRENVTNKCGVDLQVTGQNHNFGFIYRKLWQLAYGT
jgi:hypothetical protein